MSQKNTLFKYFSKSPSVTSNGVSPKSSPKPNGDVKLNGHKDHDKSEPSGTESPKRVKHSEWNVCDLVWAKLDTYPWWPSLVCNDPDSGRYTRPGSVHVQFFDEPPTRAWVRATMVQKYTGSSGRPVPSTDVQKWKKACQEGDKVLKLSHEERENIIAVFSLEEGDEEEDDQKDESLDLTGDSPLKAALLDSEDSADEFKPGKDDVDSDSDEESEDNASEEEVSEVEDEPDSPVKSCKRKRNPKTPQNKNAAKKVHVINGPPRTPAALTPSTKARLSVFEAKESPGKSSEATTTEMSGSNTESWAHLKLDFLKPNNIKDAKRRPPSDPDYDPRTVYVPDDFKRNQTPAMRQWWDIKSQHFDCVLFFKVGKFYELYHMDAVTGYNELGLVFMKGDFAHSGFPEIAYGRFSASLIDKGYKVARVEQTETPDMMNERCKNVPRPTKFDKVVKREVCQVTSCGTRTFSVMDGEPMDGSSNKYLLAICEKMIDSKPIYGVCFLDTSIGIFHLGQFEDDRHCSGLFTLVAHYPPVQVLYERRHASEKTMQVLNGPLSSAVKESLAPETEFWSATETLKFLAEGNYFDENGKGHKWPQGMKPFISEVDSLGLCPADDKELAVRALGAVVFYLKRCHLEQQLLSMGRFETYDPEDMTLKEMPAETETTSLGRHMILDGTTLKNLDVLRNSMGDREGTLINSLDQCCTAFGKRLLYQWICSPLLTKSSIVARQEAITDLSEHSHVMQEARGLLAHLPDLERQLSKIHTQGNAIHNKSHPDSRAIFYEEQVYSKKKIQDFSATLKGFKSAQKVAELFQGVSESLKSKLLRQITCFQSQTTEGSFPDMTMSLDFFDNAFNHEEAQKEGRIIPSKGVDSEYDKAVDELNRVESELDEYLQSQKKYFGCKVSYFGTDKKRFQLEVPEHACKKAGNDYELQSQKKGYKRFWTSTTKKLLADMTSAEDQKKSVLKDLSRRIFAQFSAKFEEWNAAVQCMAALDVLMSLAVFAQKQDGVVCVPKVAPASKDSAAFVCIREGRHPCLAAESTSSFVPNDTIIGRDNVANVIIVTGPNMGGKSTLMRQAGLLLIMAHMGCHIPAEECEFTPVDRIFTRLGANDDIMAGESTFFVELSETSAILSHATKHSLVLVDELGRGTSTYDGTAIAAAVVRQLCTIGARVLFSTHYHTLVEEFRSFSGVSLGHMACMVEDDGEEGGEETVTFLYKFSSGACPKSYGFNAARLAGVPAHITRAGQIKAAQLEREAQRRRLFRELCAPTLDCSMSQFSAIISQY